MSAVTGKGPKKVPASSGVVGENVKEAESKPVRPASRSPDEARADAVARVASLEAAIAALGDHDDQVRKSLEESLAKAKKSTNVAPVGVRLNSANVPAPPLVNVEAQFRRMQRVIDELQAELARLKSKEIRAKESDEEDREVLATDLPQSKKSRRTGPGMQPSLLAIGGAAGDPSALMSTHRPATHRDSNQRFEIWSQGNESGRGGEPRSSTPTGFRSGQEGKDDREQIRGLVFR